MVDKDTGEGLSGAKLQVLGEKPGDETANVKTIEGREEPNKTITSGSNGNFNTLKVTPTDNNGTFYLTIKEWTAPEGYNKIAGDVLAEVTYDTTSGQITNITFDNNNLTYSNGVIIVKNDNTIPELTGITVKTRPTKTEYIKGEELNPIGLRIELIYDDGNTREIEYGDDGVGEIILSGYDKNKLGTQTITVTYEGMEATFNVTVTNNVIGIEVKNAPTTCLEGEDLDLNGAKITVTYQNGDTEDIDITEDMIENFNKNQVGMQTVTVTYEGMDTTFNVTVRAKTLTGITIITPPTKTTYTEGEDFNPNGMVVKASYDNGTTATITNYTIVDGDSLELDQETVTISYEEGGELFTATQTIMVVDENILKDDSIYNIDEEDGIKYIIGILPETQVEEFIEEFKPGYEIRIYNNNQEITNNKDIIKTNMRMEVYKNNQKIDEYILVVKGDCNASGTTNVADLTKLMMNVAESLATNKDESKILTGAFKFAVDLNRDGILNASDITLLSKYIADNK